ncbi:MAG: hypothetical protein H8D23_17580 [Candidatus Brocadiales bacterium]|nr:hypothetical protein [Candidatus Brocadiales bacterium]
MADDKIVSGFGKKVKEMAASIRKDTEGWALTKAEQDKQFQELQREAMKASQAQLQAASTRAALGRSPIGIPKTPGRFTGESETTDRELLYKILSAQGMIVKELSELREEINKLKE